MKRDIIKISESKLCDIITECINEGFSLDPKKIYQCGNIEEVKNVMFDIMINEGSYAHDSFVGEIYYKNLALMFYMHGDGSCVLQYHGKDGTPKTKYGGSFGELCKFALTLIARSRG